MEFKDIVKNRCSIRQFEARAVPEETIHELLEITSYAASAINLQPWKIRVVSDQETKDKLFPVTFNQNHVEGLLPPFRVLRRNRLPRPHRRGRCGYACREASRMAPGR